MTTLSGEITIIDVADGKNYVLNIVGGTRSVVYDKDGKNPLPVATNFDYELLEDGRPVSPESVLWTTSGRMTGSGTDKLFKPVYTTDVNGGTGGSAVLLDVVYKGLILKAVAPISISQIGATGSTGGKGEKGDTGTPGKDGEDGVGIVSIEEKYLLSDLISGVEAGGDSWLDQPQVPSKNLRYLWNYEIITYTDGTVINTEPAVIGMYSEDGRSITGISEKYMATDKSSGITNTTGVWHDEVQPLTPTNKYLWNYEIISYDKEPFTQKTKASMIGVYGDQGIQGDKGENAPNLTVQYSASSTGSSPSNTFRPTDKYMRTYNGATYSAWMKIVGEDGSDGAYTNFEFAKGTLAAATGAWQDSPPVIGVNEHVWMRKAQVDKAGSQGAWSTPTRLSGAKGDTGEKGSTGDKGDTGAPGAEGRGIDSIQEYYAINNSMTAPAIGNAAWKTTLQIPTKTNRNLWNYELITYTKGLPATKTTVPAIIGMYSEDGRSLKSIVEKYKISSSPTGITNATTDWDNTPPLTDAVNKYLWNYAEITYLNADGSETLDKNPAAVIGVYGDKGDQGIQGETGLPGRSILSVDVLYGVSTNSGTEPKSWDTLAPAWKNGQFIWSKTVTSYSSGKPTESTPAVITGGQGGVGATGRGISSIKEQYAINEDKSKAPVDWVDEPMPWTFGSYIWTRSVITYTTGSPRTETTKPLVSSEWEAVDVALEMAKEDATAKANAAKAAADLVAVAKADLAEENAKAHADGIVSTEEQTRIDQAAANLAAAKKEAKDKADEARLAAEAYARAQDALLEIGGRNLLLDSMELFHELGESSLSLSNKTLAPGEYTISFDYEVSDAGGTPTSFLLYTDKSVGRVPIKAVGENRTSLTFTLDSEVAENGLMIYFGDGSANSRLNEGTFTELKLEKGNTATDWTPAPEDDEVAREDIYTRSLQYMDSSFEGYEEGFLQKVKAGYTSKEDLDNFVAGELESIITQTAEQIDFAFIKTINESIDSLEGSTNESLREIANHITFTEAGNILLSSTEDGDSTPIMLQIKRDRISFISGTTEVAWFSDNKLYVKDGEFTDSLVLGNFGFTPKDSGNLSFGKVK